MADKRTVFRIQIPSDATVLHQKIVELLTAQGYQQITYSRHNGTEIVWRWTDGSWMPMRYIKLDYQPGVLVISAWICYVFGNFTNSETSLEGFSGALPKGLTKNTVDDIARMAQAFMGTAPQQ